jgi:mannose-6-phosphate isomerase-like protein (cupin superfamily)
VVAVSPHFERDGYLGPVPILDEQECRTLTEYLERPDVPEPPDWEKARAVRERFLYDIATRREIVEPVADILGSEVVLWGVNAVRRVPGQVHPWHSDIESYDPEGGFVSVWIGVENTSRESSLQLIRGSHRLGHTVQQARGDDGLARDDATPDAMLAIARRHDPDAELVTPEMTNGDALFFDGRLWHGSDNRRGDGDRVALLLQFAAADRRVRIPDWDALDWPFRYLEDREPPTILVHGTGRGNVNLLVAPPPRGERGIGAVVHRFHLPVDSPRVEPWQPFPAFSGRTATCTDMSCHASVLAGGHSPHEPHAHAEEELLIPLHGVAELVVADSADDPEPRLERVEPGAFVYYPAGQHHTIRNPGPAPVAYLMFKWRADGRRDGTALGTELVRFDGADPPEDADGFWSQGLLDSPTEQLAKLHSHVTVLQPGAGYEPHADEHDVAIVTLTGRIQTLGRTVSPGSVVYFGAGTAHGMRNVGTAPARYLVFEFHRAERRGLRRLLPRR